MHFTLDKFPTHVVVARRKTMDDKYVKINNQQIYNSGLARFTRNNAVKELHSYIKKEFLEQYPHRLDYYPVNLEFEFHTVINHGAIKRRKGIITWNPPKEDYEPNWDIENLASIWIKCINDVLQELLVIPDDNVKYVKKISYEFKEVEQFEDRKIIVKLT